MSTQLQLRRGTTAQHSTFTGASGEITIDTDKKTVVVHDGTTAGGMPVLPKTITDGTANGVLYLNGSKQVTSGSGLVFDSSGNLGIGVTPSYKLHILAPSGGTGLYVTDNVNATLELKFAPTSKIIFDGRGNNFLFNSFTTNLATLDSSGNLGIGTASPGGKLELLQTSTTTPSLRLRYNSASYYADHGFNPNGDYQISTPAVNGVASGRLFLYANGTLLFGTGSSTYNTPYMTLDASGNLLVGTDKPNSTLGQGFNVYINGGSTQCFIGHLNGTTSGTYYTGYSYNGTLIGSITQSGTTGVAFNTSSDYRLKEDYQPVEDAIARLNQLKPINFKWKSEDRRCDGFLAHELQEVIPEAATGHKDEMRTEEYEVTPAVKDEEGNVITEAVMGEREVPVYQGIDQSKIVPLLTAALQEAVAKIESLTQRIEALEYTKQGE